jgi:hypothetical protein
MTRDLEYNAWYELDYVTCSEHFQTLLAATEVCAISLNFSPGSLKEDENCLLTESQIWLHEISFL